MAIGLPTLSEHQFDEFELLVQQRLGFAMNDPQRLIMRTVAGLESDNDNLMIQASPGAGKTTLIIMVTMMIEMMKTLGLMRDYPKVVALAHMRQNRAMLEHYLPHFVDKKTVHKLGWSLCQQMSSSYSIAKWKIPNITSAALKEYYPQGVPLKDEDGIMRNRMVGDVYWPLSRFINILITSLVDANNQPGIEWLYEMYTPNILGITDKFRDHIVNSLASEILNAIDANRKEAGYISFEEMVTVPIRAGWFNQQYDIVMVDEGQDLSPAQQIIVERIAKYKFVVGDRNQSIMRFAGADNDSWNRLSYILDAQTLTMPITQRCPVKVVSYLQSVFKEVVPRKDAPQGMIKEIDSMDQLATYADRPCTGLVCRTHADVAESYVEMMRADVKTPIVVLGSDVYGIVKSTITAMSKIKSILGKFDKESFSLYLSTWQSQEIEKANQGNLQAQIDVRIEEVKQAANTVSLLNNFFDPASPDELIQLVGARFGTEPDEVVKKQKEFRTSIVIGTAYMWKGLETKHIIIYQTENYLQERGLFPQEKEVLFVAMSRAQESLAFYPYAPVSPVTVAYDIEYEVTQNRTLPYPGFDTSLFSSNVELQYGAWIDGLNIWETALDEIKDNE